MGKEITRGKSLNKYEKRASFPDGKSENEQVSTKFKGVSFYSNCGAESMGDCYNLNLVLSTKGSTELIMTKLDIIQGLFKFQTPFTVANLHNQVRRQNQILVYPQSLSLNCFFFFFLANALLSDKFPDCSRLSKIFIHVIKLRTPWSISHVTKH